MGKNFITLTCLEGTLGSMFEAKTIINTKYIMSVHVLSYKNITGSQQPKSRIRFRNGYVCDVFETVDEIESLL